MKNIIARMMVNGADMVETKSDIGRLVIATSMLIDAYDVGHETFNKVEPIVKAMATSKRRFNRKRLYHSLNKVLVADYMAE